ncbi:bis(5'-nucleosyl)-tetraphosphatase (symmetrical) YqeK [Miniphocaeibacter massiliensis]|uniref:bis(5'-nucleosyl)-tetraphosphatase (symmetrical) YqeK n=1 Tax=Miniphocaeibacter massiliensis TaxID=2041841 RepID=UPI000C1BCBF9|nr:bis(5'-nucleosyl)-tetraphosphatase (symmetrical) YqeK [Miniphocaeibacter massiliensis]
MCRFEDIQNDLRDKLKKSRYEHTLRVVEKSIELAGLYNINKEKIKIAALLHDCAKGKEDTYKNLYSEEFNLLISKEEFKEFRNPFLEHCLLGAIVAKNKYKIKDVQILNAIIYHTTGRLNMNDFEKVLYLADKTEIGRNYNNVKKIREKSLLDLNSAIILSINNTILYLIKRNQEISINTILLRNSLLGGYVEG